MAAKRRAVRLREVTGDGGAVCMEAFHSSATISVHVGGGGGKQGIPLCMFNGKNKVRHQGRPSTKPGL